jgi:hypothetical protein
MTTVTLYEKPCGCFGSYHYLPLGCLLYTYGEYPSSLDDLFECRECGAVWTLRDVRSYVDDPAPPPTTQGEE